MNRANLRYSDLSVDTIRQLHREAGSVILELSPIRGEMLLSLLDQRDRVEANLYNDVSLFRLLWDDFLWSYYTMKTRLFHRKLLAVQRYVSAVDAAHGWVAKDNSSQLFVLIPINNGHSKLSLQRDAIETPLG